MIVRSSLIDLIKYLHFVDVESTLVAHYNHLLKVHIVDFQKVIVMGYQCRLVFEHCLPVCGYLRDLVAAILDNEFDTRHVSIRNWLRFWDDAGVKLHHTATPLSGAQNDHIESTNLTENNQ